MTYWALNAVFLAVVAIVGCAAIVVRKPPAAASVALTLGIVLVMTAIFDNIMIGVGLVGYERSLMSGVFVGIAPLEDFAYAIAAAVLLPSLWCLLSVRRDEERRA
jgi:lycopene cyclase domain-containing protein